MNPHRIRMAGFTLLPVILTMSLIAAIAFLLNRDNGMNAGMVSSQMDADRARYAAEAGLQAVNARIQSLSCAGGFPVAGSPVTNSNLGGASYSAYATSASGNITSLVSTGTYNGTVVTLTRNNVYVYQSAPKTYTLQPNPVTGIDSFITRNSSNSNGIDSALSIRPLMDYPLLKFDFSMFPAGSLPVTATMSLYASSVPGGTNAVAMHRLTTSWVEGNGATGVNWTTRDGTLAWTSPGGDYHPVAVAAVPNTVNNAWNNFDATNLIAAWMLGRYPNLGVILVSDPLAGNFRYDSSDKGITATRPKISFNYLLPCGTTGPSDAGNTSVTLNPVADSFNDGGAVQANNGAATTLKTSYTPTQEKRILIQFDTSSIPVGYTIQSAVLRLFVDTTPGSTANPKSIWANALSEPWVEGTGNNTNKNCPSAPTTGTSWNYRTGCTNWSFIHPPNTAQAWTAMASMPTARSGHVVVAANNKIYAIGGSNSGGYLNVVEEYDPATNTWATRAPMPTARSGAAAAEVNGMIYVIGGTNGSSLAVNEVYDPATNTWTTKTAMSQSRRFMAAAVVNNKIYVFGGTVSGTALKTSVEYDPATDTWQSRSAMSTARMRFAAGTLNNNVHAIGGLSGGTSLTQSEAYDPGTDNWSNKAVLSAGTDSMASAVLGNRMFLISGNQGAALTNAVWMYDLWSDTFVARANYPASLSQTAATPLNGKIYNMGGGNGASFVNNHYQYDPGFPVPLATAVEESSGISPLPTNFNNGWIVFDLRSLVQEWVDGVRPNYGVVIYTDVADQFSINSRERGVKIPELVVTY